MDDFLREGELHPEHIPNQKGFLKVFAAWIIEDDLAFATGETPGIHRLFEYMKSRFVLPTDTTVRNTLFKIFQELYDKVKNELKVGHWH